MRRTPWSPDDPESMRGEVDRLMSELLRGGRGTAAFRPAVDVYVSGEPRVISVEIDAAGIDPEDVHVTLDGDLLVVVGERPRPAGRRAYQHAEIEWGRFERRVRLPAAVDPERVRASYEAGLLTIELPAAASTHTGPFSVGVRRRRPGASEGPG